VLYDPTKDLAPIVNLVSGPMAIATDAGYPVNSMRELISAARAQPGKIRLRAPTKGERFSE